MKSNAKTIAGALMLAVILTIVTITSCNKNTLNVPAAEELSSQIETKVSVLLNKMETAKNDHEVYEALHKEYAALNPKELEVYNAIKLKNDSLKLVNTFNGNQVLVTEKVAFLKKLRDEVHAQCIILFNKSANKLTHQEVEKAIQAAKFIFKPDNTVKQHSKDVVALACPQMSYPYVTSQTTYTRKFQYGWANADNAPNWEPCDYEFYFDGWYHMVKDHNYDTWQVLSDYGWQVSRRHPNYWDGQDTAILLGYWTVHFYSSGAGDMYMSMDYLV